MKSTVNEIENSEGVIPVLILNWNGDEDSVECLKSVRKSVPAGFVPVLIDNGSKAESLERLKRECEQMFGKILYLRGIELSELDNTSRNEFAKYLDKDSLVFIENGENLGFAKGNNVGIRFAESIGAEWVMLLNNDTVVAPEAFQELRRFLRSYPRFSAITAQVRHFRPNTQIQNCGGDLTYFGSRKYKFANVDASSLPESDFSVVSFVTGCALLFKYKITGALSEAFFFGEDDYEFALRMKRLGLEMACAHAAVVYHKVGATIARSSRPLGSILVQYVNRLVNTRNYYSKARWHTTRALAYLHLPIISIIRRTEAHLRGHRDVRRTDYESMIMQDS